VYANPFDYAAAGSWAEAVELLGEAGEDAKVIAGGQSLIPMMTLRLATPGMLVDVNGADVSRIERRDGRVAISAVTRHSDLERSEVLAADCPMLAHAASLVGNVRVRHRGTIGGSLAHADPAAEIPCAALALDAEIVALGPDGERRFPADGFFDSYYTTSLGPADVVTAVEFPVPAVGTGWSFLELLRRTSDFAVVAVGALVRLDDGGACVDVRLAAAGVGQRPLDLTEAARPLVGERVETGVVGEVGRRAAALVEPAAAVHASSEYRRAMLEVFVRRGLAEAAGRALQVTG
jgi:CO/xanthine dehydrogenase FAD-binding subunit